MSDKGSRECLFMMFLSAMDVDGYGARAGRAGEVKRGKFGAAGKAWKAGAAIRGNVCGVKLGRRGLGKLVIGPELLSILMSPSPA
jgi:hypothetical protein